MVSGYPSGLAIQSHEHTNMGGSMSATTHLEMRNRHSGSPPARGVEGSLITKEFSHGIANSDLIYSIPEKIFGTAAARKGFVIMKKATEKMLTVKDIQAIFKCGKNQAHEIVHAEGFPSIRIGRKLYV